jgi:hypothetical protein
VPLLDASTSLALDRLEALRSELREGVVGLRAEIAAEPGLEGARALRARSAVDLLESTAAVGPSGAAPADRSRLIAEVNLLYDAFVVGAEYYRLFVKPRPYPKRPDPPP